MVDLHRPAIPIVEAAFGIERSGSITSLEELVTK